VTLINQFPPGRADRADERDVAWLDEEPARHPGLAGAKAANLALAAARGLPVVDGFVVSTRAVTEHPHRPPEALRAAWRQLSDDGSTAVVVRSSSPGEDLASSSMAGVFDSVIDVQGWEEVTAAYGQVVRSAGGGAIAVLVQRMVRPRHGGVLFGADPVTGRRDRRVIAAVDGGPHRLVAGEVRGRQIVVDRHARVRSTDGDDRPVLSHRQRRALLRLADQVAELFGGPQDIEWAIDVDGRVVLLQSRPITAIAAEVTGPVLGPGPVAETFPEPLTRLEQDLWVPPLREAMAAALTLTGSAGRRRVDRSPIVTVVDAQVVVDLELAGDAGSPTGLLQVLDPRPRLRRLGAAWRVGRLRGALDALADRLLAEIDDELAAVPPLDLLSDDDLVRLLQNAGGYLRALHGHEVLAGALLAADGTGTGTGAAAGLRALAAARRAGWSDEDAIARTPVVLALVPPTVGVRPPLPALDGVAPHPADAPSDLSPREALRLRVRWVHELSRQVVRELGHRLAERGVLDDREAVAHLGRDDLERAVRDRAADVGPVDPPGRPAPLPARFRLATDGTVVSDASGGDGGIGAGGGRGAGPVAHAGPEPGDVLVVRTLAPGLAPLLGRLGGLVAETGSPLSHLAILAREQGVPVVVASPGARTRFEPGTVVVVDGRTGTVEPLEELVAPGTDTDIPGAGA
jgi:rifampicin phosphotransferase